MNITGITNTCVITANTPFIQSGETTSNEGSIIITDENGMDVASCFGLSTNIIKSDEIICNNAIEITITEGVKDEVVCDYTGFTLQNDGLILLTYLDGSTSLNVHPECCTNIESSYTPEIGVSGYNVCRWKPFYDITDCNNYIIDGQIIVDENDYVEFSIASGGTTTVVPSTQCCYNYNLVDELTTEGVKCKEVVIPACSDYVVEAVIPQIGDVEFTQVSTGQKTTIVPTLDCCSINGLSGREVATGYICYNSLNKPTVQISLDTNCCNETVETVETVETITGPSIVTDVHASQVFIEGDAIQVNWFPASSNLIIDHYEVWRSVGDVENIEPYAFEKVIYEPTTNSHYDTDITPTLTYCYKIKAVDSAGNKSADFSNISCIIAHYYTY